MADLGELFAPDKPQTSSLDQLFAPDASQQQPSYTGGFADYFFNNTAPGRVLSAFGKGATQEWGGAATQMQKSTEQELTKMGVFNDYTSGRTSLIKSFNEAFLRPVVSGLSTGQAILGGLGAATEQTGTELQKAGQAESEEQKAHGLPFSLSGELLKGAGELVGSLPGGFLPEAGVHIGEIKAVSGDPVQASNTARAYGSIGEGEEGYFNTKPVSPENMEARQKAAQDAGMSKVPEPQPPVTDPNGIARQIEPGLFKDYDDLTVLRENLRISLDYTKSQEIGEVQRQLDVAKAAGNEDQVSNFQSIINDLQQSDSPQRAAIRDRIVDTDLKIRDLLPDVIQARKNALDYFPSPEETPKTKEDVSPQDTIGQNKPTKPSEETTPLEQSVDQGIQELKTGPETGGLKGLSSEAGTPKTAGLSKDLESSAIEKALTKGFENLPEFTSTTRDYQVKGTLKLLNEDYDNAKNIALGRAQAPADILPNVVFDAVRKKAEIEGDLDTIKELANSPLTVQTSLAAQHLGMTGKFDEESPTTLITLVQRAREAVRSNRTARAFERERQDIVNHLENSIDTAISNKEAWTDFIKSIECSY